ncbi:MAG: hypothetical protein BWY85_00231 [Firmicutes bacterium ADurb.Bin506]|nr:MAG: hypothetical protein BWY85_00231 [Firmicutes bacterium ADurb.Bin506]
MSEVAILSTVLGLLGTACAIAFGYAAYKRNHKTDDVHEGQKDGTMLTEIGYIKSGIDDIKRKQEKQDERNMEVITRMTAVEASAKQAHKRIDRLEGRADREE